MQTHLYKMTQLKGQTGIRRKSKVAFNFEIIQLWQCKCKNRATPEGALLQNETTSAHTNEENHYTVFIVILHRGSLGALVTSFVIPYGTGKDVYCFYIRLVVLFVAKRSSRSPPSSVCLREASVTLVSLISTRKDESQHARHSGDKCFAEYHVGTNEDSVRIPWKHRGA